MATGKSGSEVRINNKIASRTIEVGGAMIGLYLANKAGKDRFVGVLLGGLGALILTETFLPDSKYSTVRIAPKQGKIIELEQTKRKMA